jgi:hypothetical protein
VKVTELRCERQDLRPTLLPLLVGSVFHVTGPAAYECILQDAAIRPNTEAERPFNHSFSKVSYFRLGGCVSVCDLRALAGDELETAMGKYNFLLPWSTVESTVVIHLILGARARRRSITWADAVRESGPTIQGVPHLEAGHPGAISLEDIEEMIRTTVGAVTDPFVLAHAARGRALGE